jgi:hypothetical protein
LLPAFLQVPSGQRRKLHSSSKRTTPQLQHQVQPPAQQLQQQQSLAAVQVRARAWLCSGATETKLTCMVVFC